MRVVIQKGSGLVGDGFRKSSAVTGSTGTSLLVWDIAPSRDLWVITTSTEHAIGIAAEPSALLVLDVLGDVLA